MIVQTAKEEVVREEEDLQEILEVRERCSHSCGVWKFV